jgi:hypothetical protein
MRADPNLYAWFLHAELLDTLFAADRRAVKLFAGPSRRMRGNALAYADRLEQWLRTHEVDPLDQAIITGTCRPGGLVWTELPFHWSHVALERGEAMSGREVRSDFHAPLALAEDRTIRVHGTFNPARLTCSSANSELAGVRSQYLLGQVATLTEDCVELRPLAIATRLLAPPPRQWESDDWQRVKPSEIDQFARTDWTSDVTHEQLEALRHVPERDVKQALAQIVGEPVVPKDWGGEQSDLWTSRLRISGAPHTAAFLLKGPARFGPMTIAMLGKNGDQLQRLASTDAEILVIQHCHEIRPEVFNLLRSIASDFRHVRRYLVLDGFDTYRILSSNGYLQNAR